jgi:hypothetical protein
MRAPLLVRSSRLGACLALAALAGCAATKGEAEASPPAAKYGDPAAQSDSFLPEDMQACMLAGTPGEMHEHLAESVGTWEGTSTMWMAPGMEPMTSPCTMEVSTLMDGRYVKTEVSGDMPGMGPFSGMGISGFDNVTQKFVSTWIDSHSTGIMQGVGERSKDGKTLTWTFTYNCPIRKGPAEMREVDRMTSDDTLTLEMYGSDPKGGAEYKMMQIDFRRKR